MNLKFIFYIYIYNSKKHQTRLQVSRFSNKPKISLAGVLDIFIPAASQLYLVISFLYVYHAMLHDKNLTCGFFFVYFPRDIKI